MPYVFPPAPQPYVLVADCDQKIPVRRIFCVGRNYAAHAREMGRDPDRERPFFFCKPADAIVTDGATIPYPPQTNNLHFEGELAVVIGTAGQNIPVESALGHVWGYAVANDLTRRDLQTEAKDLGRPWDMGKGFDHSLPISAVYSADRIGHPTQGRITTMVNGNLRQSADLADMIWSIPEVIATLSQSVSVATGDVILTGTPAGVGALGVGDECIVAIDGVGTLTTWIGSPTRG